VSARLVTLSEELLVPDSAFRNQVVLTQLCLYEQPQAKFAALAAFGHFLPVFFVSTREMRRCKG
jgi:hypothetical protein